MTLILRPLYRFVQIDNRCRLLVIEAAALLALMRLSLIFLSFRQIARRLGGLATPRDACARTAGSERRRDQARLAAEIGWAVTRAARYAPFKAVCLPRATAARIMLKRRGIGSVLHFGARKGLDKPIDAHAWLDAAGVEVTGYPVDNSFAEIACFM